MAVLAPVPYPVGMAPRILLLCLSILTASAAEGGVAARAFAHADADRDGVLSAAELSSFDMVLGSRGLSPAMRERLGINDQDGDGRITAAEAGISAAALRKAVPRAEAIAGMRVAGDLPYRTVAGAPPHLTTLDVYTPEGVANAPVLVYVHGGGWTIGDKAQVGRKAAWCARLGVVLVSINYRLAPAARHPDWNQDVAAAVAWVKTHIAEHGGDGRRILLMGHSAGAHLAAVVGCDPRWLAPHGLKPADLAGVVLLDGAGYDIPLHMRAPLPALKHIYEKAFSTDPQVWTDASPALQARAVPPPFLITHAASRGASSSQADILAAALRAVGGTADIHGQRGKDHMAMNADLGKADDPLTAMVEPFLRRTLGLAPGR